MTYRAEIYYGSGDQGPTSTVLVSEEEILRGVLLGPCDECPGDGRFVLPDGETMPCNRCKTSGVMLASC